MTKEECIKLKELINEEIKRRNRINELLRKEDVKELLKLTNNKSIKNMDSKNFRKILNFILKDFKISETNSIYVCTSAWYTDCRICYEDTEYYIKDVHINSEDAESKLYRDIETGKSISATKKVNSMDIRPLISSFEKNNIVLNPYNVNNKEHPLNGYDEVRIEFFENCCVYGQPMALEMVKIKYPKL